MTLQERSRITGDIAVKYEDLLAANEVDPFGELKRYMDSMSAFQETGAEDGAVWGRFKDGRYFVFSDDWAQVPVKASVALRASATWPSESQARFPQGPLTIQRPSVASSGPELPGSNRAVLLSLDDPNDEAFVFGKGTIARMSTALQARGWAVNTALPQPTGSSLTIEALKSATGAGILYLNTHTAVFGPGSFWRGVQGFSIMTDTKASDENELLYQADLDDYSLIYHRKRDVDDPRGMPRYAATPAFILKHLKLANNSLVVLMSCNAGTEKGVGVVQALQAANAGTVIAWDGFANARGFATVELLFDRMAGTNQTIPLFEGGEIRPPDVPNRAFSFDDVWRFLDSRGLLVQQGADAKHPAAHIRRIGDGFLALAPVLQTFEVHGERFIAHGTFGSTPGKVTIGGTQVMPVWSNDKIEAVIADATHGEVLLSVRQFKGNPRVVGSWLGQLQYKNIRTDRGSCGSPFIDQIDVNAHFRADMHSVRETVDGPLLNNAHSTFFFVAPDTAASTISSGICVHSDGELDVSWGGGGPLRFTTIPNGDAMMTGRIDTVDGRFQLNFTPGSALVRTASHSNGDVLEAVDVEDDLQGFVNPGPDYSKLLPNGTFIPFDSALHVIPNQQELGSPDGKTRLQIKWGTFSVSPDLDDAIGR